MNNKFNIGDTVIVAGQSVQCKGFVGDVETIIDRHVLARADCSGCGGWIMYQLSFTASTVFCECVLRKKNDPGDKPHPTGDFKKLIDSLNLEAKPL